MAKEKSFTLVVIASFVIAVLMPFVRTLARGDNETAVAAGYTVNVAGTHEPGRSAHDRVDELSMLVVGACLLGLGGVLRRAA
jgi:hypothetical protein